MSEPSAAVATSTVAAASGLVLGMPVEAVALGALASAVVMLREERKNVMLALSSIFIGGLLGGALAPFLGKLLVSQYADSHQFLTSSEHSVMHVVAPVTIGLLWQFIVKLLMNLYPSFEKRFDDLVGAVVDFILRRPKS